jgi:hypothetical protein
MNQTIKEQWIKSLEDFCKQPAYLRLQFPLKMASNSGEMFSALGLLCELHSKETNTPWTIGTPDNPELSAKNNRLPNIVGYKMSPLIPPKEVLTWSGLSQGECSEIINISSNNSFEGVIKYLKNL